MECFVQFLDDLDDLCSSMGLVGERVRDMLLAVVFVLLSLTVQVTSVMLALRHPPVALGVALVLFTTLMYRIVTSPPPAQGATIDPAA